MPYGIIKIDTVTFTDAGVDKSVSISGLVQNPTFSGNVTVTGTLSGVTVTGTTANFTSGNFTNISGGTHTITSGVFAAGSAASPSITFTGDLNTGIYSPGADQVAISTGGSGRLFVDSSGRVGVATSAPTNSFEIVGGATSNLFAVKASSSGDCLSITARSAGNGAVISALNSAQSDYEPFELNGEFIYFQTRTGTGTVSERLRITSAGLVGIGTSSPTTNVHIGSGVGGADLGVLLSRGATTNFFEAHDGTKNFIAGTDSSNAFVKVGSLTNHPVAIVQSNAAAIYIDTSKRVGIGTTSPGVLLDVAGGNSIRVQASSSSISLPTGLALTTGFGVSYLSSFDGSGNAVDFGGVSANFIWSADTHRFTNRPATTEYVRIDSSGRVGIGTSSPSGLLHVAGQIYSSGTGYTGTNSPTLRLINSTATTGRTFGINSADAGAFQVFDASAGDATRLWLDSSGRVGINTTSPQELLHVNTGSSGGQVLRLSTNGADTGYLYQNSGAVVLGAYSTRILGFETNGTERARLDSSGRLLVGTSSSPSAGNGQYARLVVQSNTAAPAGYLSIQRNEAATSITSAEEIGLISFGDSAGNSFATINCVADADAGANDYPGRLVFSTTADGASSPTERMRITSAGAVLVNTISPISGNTNTFNSADTSINSWALAGRHTASSGSGRAILALLPNETANTSVFFLGNANSLDKFIVWSDGNVVNANNSYGGLSDVKLKENIVDANPQWDDIKALQVRNYNFKEGQTHTQIGLIAQEVELVSPGLVSESPDRDEDGNALGTVTKSVNYSVLYMKAVKALQEAMERIETLEAKVAALKNS